MVICFHTMYSFLHLQEMNSPSWQMPVFKSSLKIRFRKGSLLGCKRRLNECTEFFFKQEGVVNLKKNNKNKTHQFSK